MCKALESLKPTPQTNYDYFDVTQEFFVIDSENLESVTSKLYGYSIQNNGIVENSNLTTENEIEINGCGVYVYVKRDNDIITIKQDFNGSYGLYLFQQGKYFAISNSFFMLLEHIRFRFHITLNHDYANYMLVMELCSHACQSTMVNEITMLAKEAIININIENKNIDFEYVDYQENTIRIDSQEGIKVLDSWFAKWTRFFRNIKARTNNITIALSGGFDSRITFLLALKSGINLSEIKVHSIDSKLHTHAEDYQIATEIANYFGFLLNNNNNFTGKSICYSLKDILNICIYNKLTFHKEMYYKYRKFDEKRYIVPGAGGEIVRAYWDIPAKKLIEKYLRAAERYGNRTAEDIQNSVERITKKSFEIIRRKYHLEEGNSSDLSMYLYREARCRNHFGRIAVDDYFTNTYTMAPLLDPELSKLKLNTDNCQDKNLMISVLFDRYCPDLLKFRFEGGRSINAETIAVAKKINQKFPVNIEKLLSSELDRDYTINILDEKVASLVNKNAGIPLGYPDQYLKKIYDSRLFMKTLTKYFSDEIYHYASSHFKKASYYPMRECYPLIGIALVLNIIETNYGLTHSNYDYLSMYEQEAQRDKNTMEEAEAILNSLKDFITARIDIKLLNNSNSEGADFDIIQLSDKEAIDREPEWLQKGGKGHLIQSIAMSIDISLKMLTDGNLSIKLKGKDVRDKDGSRVPVWIDYKKFCYNSMIVFDDIRPSWHDQEICYSYPVMKDEIVRFHVEWGLHNDERRNIQNPLQSLTKTSFNTDNELEDRVFDLEEKIKILEKKMFRLNPKNWFQ